MLHIVKRHLGVAVTAAVVSSVFAVGPHVAQAAVSAINADKVDGKHAVGAGATVARRAGKLVATNGSGRLPDNIIATAPNAARLGGKHPAAYRVTANGLRGGFVALAGPQDLLVFDADLQLVSRTATQGAPAADGALELASSATEVWALFHPRATTPVSSERRQYRVDPVTGVFTEARCAHYVSPQPRHPRRPGTPRKQVTPPPTGRSAVPAPKHSTGFSLAL